MIEIVTNFLTLYLKTLYAGNGYKQENMASYKSIIQIKRAKSEKTIASRDKCFRFRNQVSNYLSLNRLFLRSTYV